jgi:threonine dehydratase
VSELSLDRVRHAAGAVKTAGKTTAVVLSGGNIDPADFGVLVNRDGREGEEQHPCTC